MADSVDSKIDEAVCRWHDALLRDGYCIIPDLVGEDAVAALSADLDPVFERTPLSEGLFYGNATRRFHGLLARTPHAAAFVGHPLILAIARAVLTECDAIQLNLTQAVELMPGAPMQPPHRDEEMWPLRTPGVEYLVNVMWPFVPYTAGNGATLVWPGSHRREPEPSEAPVAAKMRPGTALLFLGSTLHGGGANRSPYPRRGMIVSYSLGWLKPYELPWLAYPPAVARTFPREIAALAGYRAHRPNLGTWEGRCPSFLLGRVSAQPPGACDTLRPEQEAAIRAFMDMQQGPVRQEPR